MSTATLLILLSCLMALSAILSASETAFFTLRPWRVERLRRERPGPGGHLATAMRNPRVFVVTIIVGTELVNVGVSNLVAVLKRRLDWLHLPVQGELVVGVLATSGILVLLCDLVPKSMAVAFPEAVALRTARPLALFAWLIRPVTLPLAHLTSVLTERRSGRRAAKTGAAPLTHDDFRTLIDISRREGVLKPRQTDMIEAALRLGDLPVRQVMVPRPDIVAINETASLDEALELIRGTRHSRVPVFRETIDEITGVLYAKDILARRFGFAPQAAKTDLRALVRPALFVPEVMRAPQLVAELQERKVHLAIVVDEYGGTAGVVTLEDLLEEMVGEFADEFDRPIRVFRRIRKGAFWVRASMAIPEFNRRVRGRIKDPAVDTVGGYVLKLFDRVPAEGDSVSDDQFVFTVRRMKGRRILVLLVERQAEKSSPVDSQDGRHRA
ncbi:MAG TPA: hemolysin family protein [Candidatus Polarisedimenticolia bacterium]|nr:hemolysin family protein [Candidatus Polarisedimenticolia bacterium]